MNPSLPFLSFLFGLLSGSFLNVVIYRLPQHRSLIAPRSYCPHCRAPIAWYDNIPILSFLLLGGNCRRCHQRISWRYPLVELITGLFAALVVLKFGASLQSGLYFFLLVAPLVAVSFIDLQHRIIPDVISLPGIVAGVLVNLLLQGASGQVLWHSVRGIVVGGGTLFLVGWLYEKTRHREGIGMGDMKLVAMFGAFFGWKGVFFVLLLSSLVGSVAGLLLLWFFRKGSHYPIPYGPFLAGGAIAYLLVGQELITLYLQWTGAVFN